MKRNSLDIHKLITIDDNGMPVAPDVTQLIDKDIKELYKRDKTKDKTKYIQDAIVIYYLGDPKSPAMQSGLSTAEALKMAIEQADLPRDYIPDELVIKLINRYYNENIGEAGRTYENIIKTIHNTNIAISKINELLTKKLSEELTTDNIATVLNLINEVRKQASELPGVTKKLQEAKENLMSEMARGGNIVSSSMDAENYEI